MPTSPDRRAAAEKVRLGYAAYTPPAIGSTQPQGDAVRPQLQRQKRGGGQGTPAADAPRMNGVTTDHRIPSQVMDQVQMLLSAQRHQGVDALGRSECINVGLTAPDLGQGCLSRGFDRPPSCMFDCLLRASVRYAPLRVFDISCLLVYSHRPLVVGKALQFRQYTRTRWQAIAAPAAAASR